jgi:hypothetical protein
MLMGLGNHFGDWICNDCSRPRYAFKRWEFKVFDKSPSPSTKNSRCLLNAWKSSNGQPAANSHLRNSSQTNWRRVHQNLNYSRSSSGKRHEKCCTHRPSLLPIEWLSEAFGLAQGSRQRHPRAGKLFKLGHLEEVKVVTRLYKTHHAEALISVYCIGNTFNVLGYL